MSYRKIRNVTIVEIKLVIVKYALQNLLTHILQPYFTIILSTDTLLV
jgi:hypothetical protein